MTEGKHQLEHTWTIWYDSGKTRHGGNWEDNLKRVCFFLFKILFIITDTEKKNI